MSKKKLNKKGQQARAKAQNNAPRIDANKTIYDVDAKVQVFKESECAEEANVDAGVVTNGTEVVDPVTEEVIETVGEDVEVIEPDAEESDTEVEYPDDDIEEDDEDDANNASINNIGYRHFPTVSKSKAMKNASILDAANDRPEIVNIAGYGHNLISAIHQAKKILDDNDELIIRSMHPNNKDPYAFSDVIFTAEFVNWNDTGYINASNVMDALVDQYNRFVKTKMASLNDVEVDDIYYCNDVKSITSGCLMHTGSGLMPVKGRVANVSVYVPRDLVDEFIEKYTTKICMCLTSDKIPPHIMSLATEGIVPIDGIRAYYLVNIPEFLKLFDNERDKNIRLYDSEEGYSIMIGNYDNVIPKNVELDAMSYKTSIAFGMLKAASY